MEVIFELSACPRAVGGAAVTIGAYDGVHLGHRSVIAEVCKRAAEDTLASAVVTFDRHPATVVRPKSALPLLTDLPQRLELLASTGIDYAVVVRFDEARAHQQPESFIDEIVVGCLSARVVVVGSDFHFGYQRRGNVKLLEQVGLRRGFEVVGVDLLAEGSEAVSSTRIRQLLMGGQIAEAARMLGRHHEVRGVVVEGEARGGPLLGYPTANVAVPPDILLPADGIYAGYFEVPGGGTHEAAIYVGSKPTFEDRSVDGPASEGAVVGVPTVEEAARPSPRSPCVEAYLLDFSGELYGQEARVRFVAHLRPDRRFDTAEALAAQMGSDVAAARKALAG